MLRPRGEGELVSVSGQFRAGGFMGAVKAVANSASGMCGNELSRPVGTGTGDRDDPGVETARLFSWRRVATSKVPGHE
jgi:hypothetical protein